MCMQVTAVDRSPGTVSGCLVLGGALAQQWGAELAAERVLPVLCPLLASPSLSPGHFAAALQCARFTRVDRIKGTGFHSLGDPAFCFMIELP